VHYPVSMHIHEELLRRLPNRVGASACQNTVNLVYDALWQPPPKLLQARDPLVGFIMAAALGVGRSKLREPFSKAEPKHQDNNNLYNRCLAVGNCHRVATLPQISAAQGEAARELGQVVGRVFAEWAYYTSALWFQRKLAAPLTRNLAPCWGPMASYLHATNMENRSLGSLTGAPLPGLFTSLALEACFIWLGRRYCITVDWPTTLTMDEGGLVHNTTGLAIGWPGGFGVMAKAGRLFAPWGELGAGELPRSIVAKHHSLEDWVPDNEGD